MIEKIKTSIALIFAILFGFLGVYILNKENIIGVLLLYISALALVNIFEKILKISKENNILSIVLKLGVPFYIQKNLYEDLLKDDKSIRYVNVAISIIILIYEIIKNRKSYDKKFFELENLKITLISLVPFFLFKDSGIKIFPYITILVCISVYKSLKLKEINYNMKFKCLYLFQILFVLILSITYFSNVTELSGKIYIQIIEKLILFNVILLSNFDKNKIKNIVFVAAVSILIFYCSFFKELLKAGFNFNIRLGSFWDITTTGIILGMIEVIVVYFIIFLKKYELLLVGVLNFLFMILTGSKGPMLVLFISIFFIIFNKVEKKNLIKKSVILFVPILIILTTDNKIIERVKKDDGSNSARILIYEEAFEQFLEKPFQGWGLATFKDVSKIRNEKILKDIEYRESIGKVESKDHIKKFSYNYLVYSHSDLLELLRSGGIFLGVFYYLFILNIVYILYKSFFVKKEDLYLVALVLIFYLKVYGLIDNTIIMRKPEENMYYFVAIIMSNILFKKGRNRC